MYTYTGMHIHTVYNLTANTNIPCYTTNLTEFGIGFLLLLQLNPEWSLEKQKSIKKLYVASLVNAVSYLTAVSISMNIYSLL